VSPFAWPGWQWQHTDISVKVDWHDSLEAGSRKVVCYHYCTTLVLNSRVLFMGVPFSEGLLSAGGGGVGGLYMIL
jgi:hypothetical protein